ncbi:DUF4136 domain-containing protein [Zobellella maritima]|uniref:DUF4136 domain-containing protein n=1 Tax=Zobellella maritima TaxID=2059725 RepID=UPI000E300790|nr:DUF4136 domain-containing protein [Zobellella maritima]
MVRIFLFCLLLAGCASPYDYDEDVNFDQYDSIALSPEGDFQSLDGARIGEYSLQLLAEKGLTPKPADQAALWLNYRLTTETRLLTTMPRMLPRGRYHRGSGWYDEERVYGSVQEQKLTLMLTDARTRKMVWQSKARQAFPAQYRGAERSVRVEELVRHLLENYPPRR